MLPAKEGICQRHKTSKKVQVPQCRNPCCPMLESDETISCQRCYKQSDLSNQCQLCSTPTGQTVDRSPPCSMSVWSPLYPAAMIRPSPKRQELSAKLLLFLLQRSAHTAGQSVCYRSQSRSLLVSTVSKFECKQWCLNQSISSSRPNWRKSKSIATREFAMGSSEEPSW
jgi:hypothetical protein